MTKSEMLHFIFEVYRIINSTHDDDVKIDVIHGKIQKLIKGLL